jgi:hypothetical protein
VGVKVLRYEIRNINPPSDVLSAMEKQMRAVILTSEGERDAKINKAEGESSGGSPSRGPPSCFRPTSPTGSMITLARGMLQKDETAGPPPLPPAGRKP